MKNLLQKMGTATLGVALSMSCAYAGHLTDELMVSAKMTGDQEVPAVTTNAQGVASFTLNNTWDTMFVNVSLNGLSGPLTGIHVHEGAVGANGGAVVDLTPFAQGNRVITALTGSDLTDVMIANYLSGNYYLNAHTDANPNGEIRGQLVLETDWGFRAVLDTAQQTNPVTNDAWGVGCFNLSHDKSTLSVNVVADGLSGAITAAHLHTGAPDTDGGVAVDLAAMISGNTIVGTVDVTSVANLAADLESGNIYVNIHTTANPNGEIRGQLSLDKRLAFDAWLDINQQVTAPSGGANGTGAAYFSMNTSIDTVWYEVQAESLTGAITSAHLHDGALGVDGGVLVDLSSNIDGNKISGMITGADVSSDLVSKLLSGGVYINIHTSANAGGEIRGQVYRLAREGYALSLEGNQEVPTEFAIAKGGGLVTIDRDQTNAHYMIVVSDLTGPTTGVHFHNAVAGENGGVLYDLTPSFAGTGTDDAAFGYWKSTDATAFTTASSVEFRNDRVYVNVHTADKPNGEVRGQVIRGAKAFEHQTIDNGETLTDPMFTDGLLFTARLNGAAEVPAVTTDAAGVAGFLLNATRDTLWVNVNADLLSGPITGIHIHEGAVGATGGAVHDLTSMVNGNQTTGFITGFDLNKFMTNAYYLNIHTDANPDGEIRGQIAFETDWTFMADLDGAQEVPMVTTNAYGKGVFNLSRDNSNLEIRIVTTGLSGAITGAHLHTGSAGATGGVAADLSGFIKDNSIVANIDPSSFLADLNAGDIYINIHTDANPNGEIRGQLEVTDNFVFDAWFNGAQEVPEAQSPGQGVGAFWLNETWDEISYDIVLDQLSGAITGAHIHDAVLGSTGGVDVDLTGDINGNRITGTISGSGLTTDVITKLLLGQSYVNIHTAAFPNGEVRGQIYRLARDGYSFDMCGEQEVPAVVDSAYGGGVLSIDRNHSNVHLMFTTTQLTGAITGAHLHNAAIGANGGVLADVSGSLADNSGFSYFAVSTADGAEIKASNVYLNVHTSSNADGELRGQIDNTWGCPDPKLAAPVSIQEFNNNLSVSYFPNPITDNLSINYNTESNDAIEVKITNVIGKVVYRTTLNNSSGNEQINMSNQASGIYMLEVKSGEKRVVEKLIKQ